MRFTEEERRLLLTQPGIGPTVVERLEGIGIQSLDTLRRVGVKPVVERICQGVGSAAWANRRRALARVLERSVAVDRGCATSPTGPAIDASVWNESRG